MKWQESGHVRWGQRTSTGQRVPAAPANVFVISLAIVLLLSILPLVKANALAPVVAAAPVPTVALPPQVDLIDDYEGQTLCDPTPKPGTLKLRDTLWRAYGSSFWASISRDCDLSWAQGISEHKDGRAIDWGVSVRNGSKAIGDEFFAWATANQGENARRMGIMYIIWDSRMWRLYDMERGFTEYRTCVSGWTATSYDTTCHRDHMHISMTWHGAGAETSWYDGSAVTLGACPAGVPVTAKPGSPSTPSVLFDPLAGVGAGGGKPCYLGSSIQAVKLSDAGQGSAVQKVRVTRLSTNAPSPVKIWTNAGGRLTLGNGSAGSREYSMSIASDRLIYVQQPVGQADIRIEGLGPGTPAEVNPGWVQHPGEAFDVAFTQIQGGWEMFHIGHGNLVYRKKLQNRSGTGWEPIPGLQAKRIAATTSPDGRVELFYIGTDNAIYHNWESTPGGGISNGERLGGFAKEIAAARSGNTWEVFHIGGNDQIFRMNGNERSWRALPRTWASALAATTSDDGRIELFHIGGNHQTYHAWQSAPGSGFGGPFGPDTWQGYGDDSSAIAAARGVNGTVEVYTIGVNGSMWRWAPGVFPGWQRLTGSAAARIAATNSADGRIEVLAMNRVGTMWHAWQKSPGKY